MTAKPPPSDRWPVRLLYRFDPLLFATKDKSWLIDVEHYKRVWRGSAHVEAVLLVQGRIKGTWRYDRTQNGVEIRLSPFGPIRRGVQWAANSQAAGIAEFTGLQLSAFEVLCK